MTPSLSLPLLVLWLKLVNDIDPAFTANDYVIGADFLDASTHFHADHPFRRVTHCLYY